MESIALQTEFRPAIPNVYGSCEYREFREILKWMDEVLRASGIEEKLVDRQFARWEKKRTEKVSQKRRQEQRKVLRYALRCNLARHLMGESFRVFSIHLADSDLLRMFTGINGFDRKKAGSRSSLERYDKLFPMELVKQVVDDLNAWAFTPEGAQETLGLEETLDLDAVFVDCTCVKANIHVPVDWLLLHDAVHTLIAAITLIRKRGLKHRMPPPESFTKQINGLCIAMTHEHHKKDSKKKRKKILRAMKEVVKTVRKHAQRYHALLDAHWEETTWTRAETVRVLERMEHVLERLPEAVRQAHERIIGERHVSNANKILSLYDDYVHVIVRGKASAATEFGNKMLLAEQQQGLIVDWELFKDDVPNDTRLTKDCATRLQEAHGPMGALSTDRGFDSKANREWLHDQEIFNAMCPRDPNTLAQRAQEPRFLQLQKRRAQTEGRIGIFKNVFLGSPLRSKGFEHRRNAVAWCVLTHNLWVLARLAYDEKLQRLIA